MKPNLGLAQLPKRVRDRIADSDRVSERLIAAAQLALGALLWSVYLAAPKASDAPVSLYQPASAALSAFTLFSLFRFWLIARRSPPGWFVALSIIADVGLVLGLVWSFHIEYGKPASVMLKAPTFLYLFVLIAIRALRFDPRYIAAAGIAAAAGWAALTTVVALTAEKDVITHSFVDYLAGERILVGAEAEKVLVLLIVTAVLVLSSRRAQSTLVAAVREQTANLELSRFFAKGVADQITSADRLVEAGAAEEREAAILMLDIRGFTNLAMQIPPDEVVRLLTSFHQRIIPIVRANGGGVDKFLGDGIMVTFGAATASQTASADALRCLEGVLQEADAWQNQRRTSESSAPLRVNASVASGRVLFATLGGGDRLEYTVIGDAVNLSAKLEKHNKTERSLAAVAGTAFTEALAQGYLPQIRYEKKPSSRIDGVEGVMDIFVVMA